MNSQVEICLDDLVAIQHELKAPKDKTNTFGKYKYRSCESILEAVKPLLHKYGCKLTLSDDSKEMCGIPVVIAIATFIDSKGNQTLVKAEAGVEINKKGMDVAQTFGASSSYARKYALNGLFLIDDTKDADSNEFHNQYQAQQNHQPRQQAQQEYEQDLRSIKSAENLDYLTFISNKYKGSQVHTTIRQACKAKSDKEGWLA